MGVVVWTCSVAWLISATRAEPMLGWFLVQYEVPDSLEARSLVRAYLFRTRAWRVIGAFVGLTMGPVAFALADREVPLLACIGLGWMVGGLCGEIAGHRVRRAVATASQTVPSMLGSHDLLPRTARHTIVSTALVTVLAIGMAVATRTSTLWLGDGEELPPVARLVGVVTASAVLALVSWRGIRAICEQPLHVTGSELDLVEHAIRAASAVRVVAGWGTLQLLATGWLSWQTADATRAPVSWLAGAITMGALIGAAAAFWWMPTHLTNREPVDTRDNTGPIAST